MKVHALVRRLLRLFTGVHVLLYLRDGDDLVIVASAGGSDHPPDPVALPAGGLGGDRPDRRPAHAFAR